MNIVVSVHLNAPPREKQENTKLPVFPKIYSAGSGNFEGSKNSPPKKKNQIEKKSSPLPKFMFEKVFNTPKIQV